MSELSRRRKNGQETLTIDTGGVLPREEGGPEEEAVDDDPVAESRAEGSPDGATTDSSLLLLNVGAHRVKLLDKVGVVGVELADVGEVFLGLLDLVDLEEPTGRLDEEEASKGKETTGDDLHGEGDAPLRGTFGHGLEDTVVDEKADDTADLPADLVDTDGLATHGHGGDLGNVDGSQVGGGTDSETGDGATDIDGSETSGSGGDGHDDRADKEDDGSDEKTPLATEVVSERETSKGTEEGTGLVSRYEVALRGGRENASKGLFEGGKCERATDECAIIANHTTGKGGNGCKSPYSPVVDTLGSRAVLDTLETHDDGVGVLEGDGMSELACVDERRRGGRRTTVVGRDRGFVGKDGAKTSGVLSHPRGAGDGMMRGMRGLQTTGLDDDGGKGRREGGCWSEEQRCVR